MTLSPPYKYCRFEDTWGFTRPTYHIIPHHTNNNIANTQHTLPDLTSTHPTHYNRAKKIHFCKPYLPDNCKNMTLRDSVFHPSWATAAQDRSNRGTAKHKKKITIIDSRTPSTIWLLRAAKDEANLISSKGERVNRIKWPEFLFYDWPFGKIGIYSFATLQSGIEKKTQKFLLYG